MTLTTIPTIDLRDAADPDAAGHRAAVDALGEGLQRFGFVILDQHGVRPELVTRAYDAFQRFFELPPEVKSRYSGVEGGARGYTPFGVEHAKDHPVPDLKEFWHVGQELAVDHPFRSEYPGNVWPVEVPELRDVAIALYRGIEASADTMLRCVAEFFDLPPDTFAGMMRDGNTILRAIHYPPVPAETHPDAVRAAAHEDINLVTLLVEATESGLEILSEGRWIPVRAQPGQIVADVGDMLARTTNDVLPATTHRVVNAPGSAERSRYSMPVFVHPYSACDLTVMEAFTGPDRPPKYPPITAGAFLDQRLREIGLKA
jgi:isopenicillin N synthase-like dioxygenase